MLKRILFIGLIVFGLFSIISAQSGRRIKTAPTPDSDQNSRKKQEAGYSESSPSRSIPIFAKSRSDKIKKGKSKKDKDSKAQTIRNSSNR